MPLPTVKNEPRPLLPAIGEYGRRMADEQQGRAVYAPVVQYNTITAKNVLLVVPRSAPDMHMPVMQQTGNGAQEQGYQRPSFRQRLAALQAQSRGFGHPASAPTAPWMPNGPQPNDSFNGKNVPQAQRPTPEYFSATGNRLPNGGFGYGFLDVPQEHSTSASQLDAALRDIREMGYNAVENKSARYGQGGIKWADDLQKLMAEHDKKTTRQAAAAPSSERIVGQKRKRNAAASSSSSSADASASTSSPSTSSPAAESPAHKRQKKQAVTSNTPQSQLQVSSPRNSPKDSVIAGSSSDSEESMSEEKLAEVPQLLEGDFDWDAVDEFLSTRETDTTI